MVISTYIWIIIVQILLNWLVTINMVNTSNRAIYLIGDAMFRLTEPVMKPIRKFVPAIAGFDLAPIVVVLLLFFIRNLIIVDNGRGGM